MSPPATFDSAITNRSVLGSGVPLPRNFSLKNAVFDMPSVTVGRADFAQIEEDAGAELLRIGVGRQRRNRAAIAQPGSLVADIVVLSLPGAVHINIRRAQKQRDFGL